jgi:hypothetical protein
MLDKLDKLDIVDDVFETVDDNIYSRAEHEADITSRHLADSKSDSKLSKAIRPVITIWAMAINTFIWVWAIVTQTWPDPTMTITAGGVLTSAIGFYFYSKKTERVVAKKAAAAIQIVKMEAKLANKEKRQQLRDAKREARKKRKEEGS